MENNYCVIMAGGIGSRFWPMSRSAKPKQFIDILGIGETLLQQTYNRFDRICKKENIYIVTNEHYTPLVLQQIPDIQKENILSEPLRRNTAPCIAYASYKIYTKNPNANIVIAPSDHLITKEEEFYNTINIALNASKTNNWLITLGIQPTRPDTGYGYIQYIADSINEIHPRIKKVKTFTEKPNIEIAKTFIESGEFLWNSGIFIWQAKNIIEAFSNYLPDMHAVFEEGENFFNGKNEDEFIKEVYPTCKNISIDYGIMEKAKNVYVVYSDFGWSDLGTWGSLYENIHKDINGNGIIGKNVITYDTDNCIINMPKDKLVVLQGLEDYIVVESDNILLICKKSEEQKIKEFVNTIKIDKGKEFI